MNAEDVAGLGVGDGAVELELRAGGELGGSGKFSGPNGAGFGCSSDGCSCSGRSV